MLEPGTALLVSHRRLFEKDHARHFIGVVDEYEAGVARVRGHTWVRDPFLGTFERKAGERTKIISLASGAVIVYALPATVDLPSLALRSEGASTVLCDDRGFSMDLTESAPHPSGGGRAGERRSA